MPEQDRTAKVKRYRGYLQDEVNGAALFQALADAERNEERAAILRRLAETEERHATRWVEKLREAGAPVGAMPKPGLSPRVLGMLARRFGAKSVLPIARSMELRAGNIYVNEPEAQDFVADEREHARTMVDLAGSGPADAGATTDMILRRERWHRGRDGGGSLRAAIFGVEDGLVSNLSLVMGVAGADPGRHIVLLSGIAGLLAGSFSMAAGEYLSMSAQRELFERQIGLEREELRENPEEEQEELALIYQAKGVPVGDARAIASRIVSDPRVALDTLAREELGLNPDELGSPWAAALSSFVLFAVGALLPLLPYFFGGGAAAVIVSAALAGLGLLVVGVSITLFTGRNPVISALRMLGIGAGAAIVTFIVGRLIGVNVAG
jgi:VIT1/CCC1 family predicted Fe2+/Mn2+ transporter